MTAQIKTAFKYSSILAALAGVLFADKFFALAEQALPFSLGETGKDFFSFKNQQFIFAVLWLYFITFSLLRWQKFPEFFRLSNPELWLAGALLINAIAFVHSTKDHPPMHALFFMGGASIYQSIQMLRWIKTDSFRPFSLGVLCSILILLLIGLFWQTGSSVYRYHGQNRWIGPWAHPNAAGLMLAGGLVLASGLALRIYNTLTKSASSGKRVWEGVFPGTCSVRLGWTIFFLIVFLILGLAMRLTETFSRGAFFAAVCGMVFLFWQPIRSRDHQNLSNHSGRLFNVPRLTLFFLIIAAFFFLSRSNPAVYLFFHRLSSIFSSNDFSSQNRMVGWQGALQIIGDRFYQGAGWDQVVSLYDYYYMPSRLNDGAVIQTNDYLFFGSALGAPALLCFGVFLKIAFTRKSDEWLKKTYQAATLVLLIGFWFDGGMFELPTVGIFWILLGLISSQPPAPPLSAEARLCSAGILKFVAGFAVIMVGAIIWAKAGDFSRKYFFSLSTAKNQKFTGIALVPNHEKKHPVVIYAHGFGGGWRKDGGELTKFAEMGLAAVAFDFNSTNSDIFDEQIQSVQDYLHHQPWADLGAVAWVGSSLGAQEMLRYGLLHHKDPPRLIVRLSGGWIPELDSNLTNPILLRCPFLLVHGGKDQTIALEETTRLAALLRKNNVPVDLKIIPQAGHGLGPDRPQIDRLIAEYCRARLVPDQPFPQIIRVRPFPFWICMAPAFAGMVFCYGWRRDEIRKRSENIPPKCKKNVPAFRPAAVIFGILLAGIMACQLMMPYLPVSENALFLARHSFTTISSKEDFENLASLPIWSGQKLGVLLENVELSHYTVQQLINWKTDKKKYLEYVLNPVIANNITELNWRRELWDNFYRRVRNENIPESATEIVVRFLRERVTIAKGYPKQVGAESAWNRRVVNLDDFEILYVAALRSIGVPARLNPLHQAEFWAGSEWQPAPRPLATTWVE